MSAKDTSWWSKAKDTVKDWGESIKGSFAQTWNEIKDVASTAFTNTQTAVSNFISNTQSNFSKWGEQAKADFKATENQIKNVVKNSLIGETIKEKISKVATYPMINNTDAPFYSFPGDDEDSNNSDGGINLETWQGYKISDGWSVTITTTGEIDKNGKTVFNYEPKNEVSKNHPILRTITEKNFNLQIYDSYEEWISSGEAGWLQKQPFKDAKKFYDNSKKQ